MANTNVGIFDDQLLVYFEGGLPTGRVTDRHTIDMGCPAMVHDCVVSENYAIFLISPAQFRLDLIMQGRAGRHDAERRRRGVPQDQRRLARPGEPLGLLRHDPRPQQTIVLEGPDGLTARVRLPVRVPFGFHGSWADQDVLDKSIAASEPRREVRQS